MLYYFSSLLDSVIGLLTHLLRTSRILWRMRNPHSEWLKNRPTSSVHLGCWTFGTVEYSAVGTAARYVSSLLPWLVELAVYITIYNYIQMYIYIYSIYISIYIYYISIYIYIGITYPQKTNTLRSNITMFNREALHKSPCSITILVYCRVLESMLFGLNLHAEFYHTMLWTASQARTFVHDHHEESQKELRVSVKTCCLGRIPHSFYMFLCLKGAMV